MNANPQDGKVAILMTCHNRNKKTLACLDSLFNQKTIKAYEITVYLVDDGSTDGTTECVRAQFPSVRVIKGSGSLFWNQGMRLAWKTALQDSFEYYILLNDDVVLHEDALAKMIQTCVQVWNTSEKKAIVTGTLRDPVTGKRSYGGAKFWPNSVNVEPGGEPIKVDHTAGNLLLVPREVVEKIGILDPAFTHGLGDYDFTLRASNAGIEIFVAPDYQGYCEANVGVSWLDPQKSFVQRWRALHSPKGPPPNEYFVFAWRHKGARAILSIPAIYIRLVFPRLIAR